MSETERSLADLEREERKVAGRLDMSGHRMALVGGPLLVVFSWFLPYTGPITGLDIGLMSQASVDYGIAAPERMFVWLCALGPVGLTLSAYFLKSTKLGQIGWIISGISMFFSVFAIWMRQTRDQGAGPGVGLFVAALAVLVVVYGLYNIVTLRSQEQEEVAQQRRLAKTQDPIALEQQALLDGNKQHAEEELGLTDDRRQKSARRRKELPRDE